MARKGMVPAEPVRRAIEEWLAERALIHGADSLSNAGWVNDKFTPMQQLTFAVWGHEDARGRGRGRIIMRLLDRREGRASSNKKDILGNPLPGAPLRQEHIKFDLADLILTKLGLGYLWHTDPELADAFESVDLAHLDARDATLTEAA